MGYTFSLGCTLISVGRMAQGGEWSRFRRQDSYSSLLEKNSPGQSFLRADSFSLGYTLLSVGGMAQGKEWSKYFLRADSFSPGYTLFSVGGMAQGEKWSRLKNQK